MDEPVVDFWFTSIDTLTDIDDLITELGRSPDSAAAVRYSIESGEGTAET